jgi:hypothetical protein
MRDLHNNIGVQQTLDPVVASADQTGAVVDSQGFGSVEHLALIGQSGDTLSGSVKIDIKLQHGDAADGSDMAAVTDALDVLGTTPDTNGIFATIDAAAEDEAVYRIGYRGTKRYSRLVVDLTGTHTNGTPVGLAAIKGHPALAPTT